MTASVTFLAQIRFGGFLELGQDHRRDLRRRILLAQDFHAGVPVVATDNLIRDHLHLFTDFLVPASHEALNGKNGILGIGDGLPLGDLTDQPFAAFGESHDRRRGPIPFLVGNDRRLAAFHDSHHRIGGPQIDSDDFAHANLLAAAVR